MKTSFQDGVDAIYNAIVAQGTTPGGKSPADLVSSISTMALKPITLNLSVRSCSNGHMEGNGHGVGHSEGHGSFSIANPGYKRAYISNTWTSENGSINDLVVAGVSAGKGSTINIEGKAISVSFYCYSNNNGSTTEGTGGVSIALS